MNIISIETMVFDKFTLGLLSCNGFRCFTLELPWKGNAVNQSCIPAGQYRYFYRDSPLNGACLQLEDVDDRSFIQIHSGNFVRQTKGCILIGDGIKYLDKDDIPDVTNSKATLQKLLKAAGTEGVVGISRCL